MKQPLTGKTTLDSPKKVLRAVSAICIALTVMSTGSTAIAQEANSQNSETLSVSPPTIELDGVPGQTITKEVTLHNMSKSPRSIRVNKETFKASGEEGQAQINEDEEENDQSFSTWIKVSPETVTIPSQSEQKFKITITIPKSAPPGGHFGALIFEPGVDGSSGGANVQVVSRITTLILLRLPGNATEKASIASIDITKESAKPNKEGRYTNSSLLTGGPVAFHVRAKNEGNIQLKPQTTIEVRNMWGAKVATLNAEARNVLPDSIRRFDTTWENKNPFGRYTVKVTMRYGANGQTVTETTSFWAFPTGRVLIGLGIAVGLFVIFWIPRKRWRKAIKALSSGD